MNNKLKTFFSSKTFRITSNIGLTYIAFIVLLCGVIYCFEINHWNGNMLGWTILLGCHFIGIPVLFIISILPIVGLIEDFDNGVKIREMPKKILIPRIIGFVVYLVPIIFIVAVLVIKCFDIIKSYFG